MMKKVFLWLLIISMIAVFFLAGCKAAIEEEAQEEAVEKVTEKEAVEKPAVEEVTGEPEEALDEQEAEAKLEKIDSLLTSKAIQLYLSVSGIVKEISGRNLTITGITETGEETSSLVVPVSQEAKIISNYTLPDDVAKEEITGTISNLSGKEYNLGEKEVGIEEIKVGDNIFIRLNLNPDYTIEGVEVFTSPVDLIPAE